MRREGSCPTDCRAARGDRRPAAAAFRLSLIDAIKDHGSISADRPLSDEVDDGQEEEAVPEGPEADARSKRPRIITCEVAIAGAWTVPLIQEPARMSAHDCIGRRWGEVYGSTVLYWLEDKSEGQAESWKFLDRRIEDVMKVPQGIARVGKLAERLPDPLRILRMLRRGRA